MKMETLVSMLLEIGEDGHTLFPSEMIRDATTGVDVETMADMADVGLERRIESLKSGDKDFARKAEMVKMLYHLRDDAEFRAEAGRLMLREYRKEFAHLPVDDAAEIE